MLYLLKFLKRRFKKYKSNVIIFLIFISTISLILLYKNDLDSKILSGRSRKALVKPQDYICLNNNSNNKISFKQTSYYYSQDTKKEVLILTNNPISDLVTNLTKILRATRIKFERSNDINFSVKKFSVIIFESYHDFVRTQDNVKLKNYIVANKIGIIVFNKNEAEEEFIVSNCSLNDDSFLENFLYTTKFHKEIFSVKKKFKNYNYKFQWLFFDEKNSKSILKCKSDSGNEEEMLFVNDFDGIKHVFIAMESFTDIWIMKSLFIDSIRYLSKEEIDIGLERYVQIDIDDIFVGPTGSRMIPDDVFELIKVQEEISINYFHHNNFKFKFNLGFCGSYYQTGNQLENEADRLLIGKYKAYFFN